MKRDLAKELAHHRALYLFIVPGVVFFLVFSYAPMFGLVMVFQRYDPVSGFLGSPWVGLDNLRRIFQMREFARAFRNTLVISSLKLFIGFPVPIIFALMLNELTSVRFRKTTQTISYLPNFISWVVIAGIWYKVLAPSGMVNQLLLDLGLIKEGINFMQDKRLFYGVIVFTDIWKGAGFSSILYLSAITSIDPEQYEAATVDGAGRLRRIWHITLPGMRNIIVLLFILSISGILNAGFDQLWTMSNVTVRDVAEILDTAVMRYLTSGSLNTLSLGAAMGFFKAVVGLVLFVVANWVSRLLKQESLI